MNLLKAAMPTGSLLGAGLFLFGGPVGAETEPASVPTEGLILRLEASSSPQNKIKIATAKPGSEKNISTRAGVYRSVNTTGDQRPKLLTNDQAAAWIFNGTNNLIQFQSDPSSAAEVTVFILAAPQRN